MNINKIKLSILIKVYLKVRTKSFFFNIISAHNKEIKTNLYFYKFHKLIKVIANK